MDIAGRPVLSNSTASCDIKIEGVDSHVSRYPESRAPLSLSVQQGCRVAASAQTQRCSGRLNLAWPGLAGLSGGRLLQGTRREK